MYSEDQWKNYVEMQDRLQSFAEEYIKEFCWDRASLDCVEIADGSIAITSESYCYGSVEHDGHYLPISYLWTENWIELEKEAEKQEKIDEEKEKEKMQLTEAKKTEEQERKKYLELKAKYGNTSPVD